MSEEIKEILFQLEIVARKHTIKATDTGNIETMPASVVDELRLNNYSAKLLLDYITNLQKENERLKKKITFNEKSRRKMQQSLMEQIETYKSRNEKAIEYVEKSKLNQLDTYCKYLYINFATEKIEHLDDLLIILQGGDE